MSIQTLTEKLIFDEWLNHIEKEALIIKRNTIKKFIELPDDLVADFKGIEIEE